MRKITLYPLLFLAFCFYSCEDGCEETELADLKFSQEVSASLTPGASSGTYDISSTVINSASNDDCLDNSNTQYAEPSVLRQTIYYSVSSGFNTKEVISQMFFETPALYGNDESWTTHTISFNKDGYYLIEHSADIDEEIHERNENNNLSQTNQSHNLRTSQIIEVQGTENKEGDEYVTLLKSTTVKK